jgi:hypothetical protein
MPSFSLKLNSFQSKNFQIAAKNYLVHFRSQFIMMRLDLKMTSSIKYNFDRIIGMILSFFLFW